MTPEVVAIFAAAGLALTAGIVAIALWEIGVKLVRWAQGKLARREPG